MEEREGMMWQRRGIELGATAQDTASVNGAPPLPTRAHEIRDNHQQAINKVQRK